jgi:hypothetical protein
VRIKNILTVWCSGKRALPLFSSTMGACYKFNGKNRNIYYYKMCG